MEKILPDTKTCQKQNYTQRRQEKETRKKFKSLFPTVTDLPDNAWFFKGIIAWFLYRGYPKSWDSRKRAAQKNWTKVPHVKNNNIDGIQMDGSDSSTTYLGANHVHEDLQFDHGNHSTSDGNDFYDCLELTYEGAPYSSTANVNRFLLGFTTSLVNFYTENLSRQTHFDTDSIFFACDNSTTSHICNNFCKFVPGTLCSTSQWLTMANKISLCLQEDTVKIYLKDDNDTKHIFLLKDCIYLLESPVNLLSALSLAEKFLGVNGYPNEETTI